MRSFTQNLMTNVVLVRYVGATNHGASKSILADGPMCREIVLGVYVDALHCWRFDR